MDAEEEKPAPRRSDDFARFVAVLGAHFFLAPSRGVLHFASFHYVVVMSIEIVTRPLVAKRFVDLCVVQMDCH